MLVRRTFCALVAGALAAPHLAKGQEMGREKGQEKGQEKKGENGPPMGQATAAQTYFYASLGPALKLYRIDPDKAALTPGGTVMLPEKIQYAWPHPSAPFLYVASSDGGSALLGVKGARHYLSALRIDKRSGELHMHGASATLRSRPIHVTVDHTGAFALVAYNNPSSVTVHRINADGTVGAEVEQTAAPICGIFAHQIRVTPGNDAAILVCRGNDKAKDKPEDPGSLKLFAFKDGQLTNRSSAAPNDGYGFGPRHLDFHPSLPFVYVSRERENKLDVYRYSNSMLEPQPVFVKDTLAEPNNIRSRQAACTLHFHPNGRTLYLANRAFDTVKDDGKDVFPGGENNIAVFSVDPSTGEPTLIQTEDVRGVYPRTFALDPTARMLAVADVEPKLMRDGAGFKTIPANIATFRIGSDGKLSFANNYQVDTGGETQFWSGMVTVG
jgi:6-phosphogluconolactonase (cycloisomerase 2 family)